MDLEYKTIRFNDPEIALDTEKNGIKAGGLPLKFGVIINFIAPVC
jgi:hypothetical protein